MRYLVACIAFFVTQHCFADGDETIAALLASGRTIEFSFNGYPVVSPGKLDALIGERDLKIGDVAVPFKCWVVGSTSSINRTGDAQPVRGGGEVQDAYQVGFHPEYTVFRLRNSTATVDCRGKGASILGAKISDFKALVETDPRVELRIIGGTPEPVALPKGPAARR